MNNSSDRFHFSSAVGWLELGNPLEANEELEKISPHNRALPVVLNVRLRVYWDLKKWAEVFMLAQALIQMEPTVADHWTNLAYAARRKPGGSLREAKAILLKAADLFPKESLIFFNLCCYESQLGNLLEAKQWLDKAFAVGPRKEIQQLVLTDPDLEPFRKEFNFSV